MQNSNDTACELLFGLLALQTGLIDQAVLVAAFHAWTRDKARSLGDHLVALGHLDQAHQPLLEGLAAAHLARHGGDAERSLAALPAGRSTHDRLAQLGDPDLGGTLNHLGSASSPHEVDSDRTATYSIGTATSDGLRFRVLRPHARGGLGAVFVALDSELHREVALKQILDSHADDAASRQRFLLEAEITGGLEHPGIVPVYGLGTYADGRPFYAMRFIRGDSLKEAIEEFHANAASKADAGRRSLGLRKLLRRFVDVCNAIDYAHSRGVLHRDIKPGNIIVGKYGETLVVDWGLAKATGQFDSDSGERMLVPASSSGSAETLPGSALGTPAYMSPEQARGDQRAMGPWSDVYSLGASLYCLLTGRLPFQGDDVGAVLRAVQNGAFPPPRQLDPTTDRALEAICLKAMAAKPADRYSSAKSLAEDVERWTADEPVTAWHEPLIRRFGRWARRHRPLVARAAMLLISAVVALSVGAVLINRERARSESNFRLARQAVDDMYTQVAERWLSEQAQLEPLQREFLTKALHFYERFARSSNNDPGIRREAGKAARRVGEIQQRLGAWKDAETAYRRALDIFGALEDEDAAAAETRRELAYTHNRLGWLLSRLRRSGEEDIRDSARPGHIPGRALSRRRRLPPRAGLRALQPGVPAQRSRPVVRSRCRAAFGAAAPRGPGEGVSRT